MGSEESEAQQSLKNKKENKNTEEGYKIRWLKFTNKPKERRTKKSDYARFTQQIVVAGIRPRFPPNHPIHPPIHHPFTASYLSAVAQPSADEHSSWKRNGLGIGDGRVSASNQSPS